MHESANSSALVLRGDVTAVRRRHITASLAIVPSIVLREERSAGGGKGGGGGERRGGWGGGVGGAAGGGDSGREEWVGICRVGLGQSG